MPSATTTPRRSPATARSTPRAWTGRSPCSGPGADWPLVLLSFPLVVLIMLAHVASVFWFDALYGFALGFLLPEWLLGRMLG